MATSLEQTIAQHCAPALAGIKPANLVSIRKTADLDAQIHAMNLRMGEKGIHIEKISATARRCTLLVYRLKKLQAHLSRPEVTAFLSICGYPGGGCPAALPLSRECGQSGLKCQRNVGLEVGGEDPAAPPDDVPIMERLAHGSCIKAPVTGDVPAAIGHLKERLKTCRPFPHEIGIFLGYPIDDIEGFTAGRKCLLSGYWKVYANPEKAERIFERYTKCRDALCRRVAGGEPLDAVLC